MTRLRGHRQQSEPIIMELISDQELLVGGSLESFCSSLVLETEAEVVVPPAPPAPPGLSSVSLKAALGLAWYTISGSSLVRLESGSSTRVEKVSGCGELLPAPSCSGLSFCRAEMFEVVDSWVWSRCSRRIIIGTWT